MRPGTCSAIATATLACACSQQPDPQPVSLDAPAPAASTTPPQADSRIAFVARFELGREAPTGQVFGALTVQAGCLVFRSRDEDRIFLALLPPGTTLRNGEVRLGGGGGVVPLGSPTLFSGGARQDPTANVGACRGDHVVLSGLVRQATSRSPMVRQRTH